MALVEGAARARELSETLEAICVRFERGATPRVQDVRYIRKASAALDRLARISQAMADGRDFH